MNKFGYWIGSIWLMALMVSITPAMADYPAFICAYEKDHNPPLDAEAERWFQQARRLERAMGPWPEVERLYQQAIAKNHWKAMHNRGHAEIRQKLGHSFCNFLYLNE